MYHIFFICSQLIKRKTKFSIAYKLQIGLSMYRIQLGFDLDLIQKISNHLSKNPYNLNSVHFSLISCKNFILLSVWLFLKNKIKIDRIGYLFKQIWIRIKINGFTKSKFGSNSNFHIFKFNPLTGFAHNSPRMNLYSEFIFGIYFFI